MRSHSGPGKRISDRYIKKKSESGCGSVRAMGVDARPGVRAKKQVKGMQFSFGPKTVTSTPSRET